MRKSLPLGLAAALLAVPAFAQNLPNLSAADVLGPAGVVPLTTPQPPARLVVDPPLPGPLAQDRVFIQYRAENLRIQPVFGPAALAVTPRIGHVHVTVDDAPWHWADASGEPIILVGLTPGSHSVQITLADANHRPLDSATIRFVVPAAPAGHQH
ncbi:hypothetical protein G5B46_15905 [Caulobacter sp. 602-2]|uniref:Copper resistance protein CopC n=1 Tax=Caulobacter sp. 602-2 TaxID=2710887 RepID=A0A6G4R059_9CAUL|nr:DUF6130 family protein [Caulobacter sp. 602-2]NGM51097.1 hypothetical protein [Caulobacter sp. 602-2]